MQYTLVTEENFESLNDNIKSLTGSSTVEYQTVQNKYIYSGGDELSYNGFSCTDYVDISGAYSVIITINPYTSTDAKGYCLYDEDKKPISGQSYTANVGKYDIEVPKTAKYIRATIGRNNELTIEKKDLKDSVLYELIPSNDTYNIISSEKRSEIITNSTANTYIAYVTGEVATLNGTSSTDKININGCDKILLKNHTTSTGKDVRGLAFYDKNKGFLSGYQYDGKNDIDINVPDGAYYIAFTYTTSKAQSFEFEATLNLNEKTIELIQTVDKENSENPLDTIKDDCGFLIVFDKVGVIGDSLASGESGYKNDDGTGGYVDLYKHSWGQYLARMTGNTYYNFSVGGMTTKGWINSTYKNQCFDGNHDCTAYFIGLGQNDKNQNYTVGSSSDIDLNDYRNNADTFYGNYAKIIQMLLEYNPKVKIFVITDPVAGSVETKGYNGAIRTIANMFSNVYLIDLYTYGKSLYSNDIIAKCARSSHYNAIGYSYMAKIIATYADWIIRNNIDDFLQVEFIDTDYSY